MPYFNRVSRVQRTLQAPKLADMRDSTESPNEIIVFKQEPRELKPRVSSLQIRKPRVLNSVLHIKNEQLL